AAEITRQQPDDTPHAATHHLAHADLLDAALRVEGGQAEQAKAGNDNRKPGEGREQLSEPPVVLVQGFEVVAEETPAQGKVGNHALPDAVDVGERAGEIVAGNTHRGAVEYRIRPLRLLPQHEDHRL